MPITAARSKAFHQENQHKRVSGCQINHELRTGYIFATGLRREMIRSYSRACLHWLISRACTRDWRKQIDKLRWLAALCVSGQVLIKRDARASLCVYVYYYANSLVQRSFIIESAAAILKTRRHTCEFPSLSRVRVSHYIRVYIYIRTDRPIRCIVRARASVCSNYLSSQLCAPASIHSPGAP